MAQPCANCPWRKDAPRQHWDPQHFRDIWANCQDDGVSQMQCHKSTPGAMLPCNGAVRRLGYESIGVRLGVMRGRIDPADVGQADGTLFEDFAAMLQANGITPPPRNRVTPR